MRDPVVRLSQVHRSFGKTHVLQGVDLDIPAGSVVGLLGKNGAGKSTLIQCLLGLRRVDAGEISVYGESPRELTADTKARIGFVSQDVELYPWMTVAQTLDYIGSFYPLWNRHWVHETSAHWDLQSSQNVGKLSRGQRQKLGILLALGHEPELLVLDEPAASLDPSARRDFLATLLDRVAELGQTVLFSTHITSDVERVADRVAILRDGVIALDDETDRLKEQLKRVRLISRHDLPRDLEVPGAISVRVRGHEAILSLHGLDDEMLRDLATQWNAQTEVHDLNLEEIFLELHHD